MSSKTSRMLLASTMVLFLAGLGLGQAGRGIARVGGVVQDAKGKPIPGAKVVAAFEDQGSKSETVTDAKGGWAFIGVGTGNWTFTATAKGFVPAGISYHVQQLSQNPKLTITLQALKDSGGLVQDESSFALLEEGNQFYKDEKYDTALAMYEQFLEKNPAAYQVLLNIGDCHREKGEYEQAIESYNKLIDGAKGDTAMGKPMGAKGLAAIGLCYIKQGKLAEAQEFFKKSIEMAPQDENLPYNVAEICFSNQQIDEAIRYFELATQIKADWPDPYLKLAYAYLNKGDMAKAAENLEKFIKLEPDTERTAQAKNILASIKK